MNDTDDFPTIIMHRDIKLSLNSGKLVETIFQGILTACGGDGVSSGISSFVETLKSVKLESSNGEKIWSLAVMSVAWSLDEIRNGSAEIGEPLLKIYREILLEQRNKTDLLINVPVDFFSRPTRLPLYIELRDKIIANKTLFLVSPLDSDESLRRRIDSSYTQGVFSLISQQSAAYGKLVEEMKAIPRDAMEIELNWSSYKSRLVYDFEVRPIFGQDKSKISTSQLYIPLRGIVSSHENKSAKKEYIDPNLKEIIWVEQELVSWIEACDSSDIYRLIGGGPGSGKSTTLRSLACHMAHRHEWRILFIPLQHIDITSDLRDAINRYFSNQTNGSFSRPPLSREAVEDGSSLILIFDGLDEISKPGEAATELVQEFIVKLTSLMSSVIGFGSKSHKVIVSGRMPAFQAAKRYSIAKDSGCIEICGFAPVRGIQSDHLIQPDELSSRLTLRALEERSRIVGDIDQRTEWWEKYAKLTDSPRNLPEAFSNRELWDITNEPLLCYLLVLSGYATDNWKLVAENLNRMYSSLIDSIWDRGWGEGSVKRRGAGQNLTKRDFNLLMQTIALAAWQDGDTRVASEASFEKAVSILRIEEVWDNFKKGNGDSVVNLAMNFYLKTPEQRYRGFEFTHKSFGDYLAARAITDLAFDLIPDIDRKIDHAIRDWLTATGSGELTTEILQFLRNEVRLRQTEVMGSDFSEVGALKLKKSFEKIVNIAMQEGFPAVFTSGSWRKLESFHRSAEIMAWAVLNSAALAVAEIDPNRAILQLRWPDGRNSFYNLINRIASIGPNNVVRSCLSYISVPGCKIFGLDLCGADLRGSNFHGSDLSGCHLLSANLSGSNLELATLERTMLDHANLVNSNLKRTRLVDTRLLGADLRGALIEDITISVETLLYVDKVYLKSLINHAVIYNKSEFTDRINIINKALDNCE